MNLKLLSGVLGLLTATSLIAQDSSQVRPEALKGKPYSPYADRAPNSPR